MPDDSQPAFQSSPAEADFSIGADWTDDETTALTFLGTCTLHGARSPALVGVALSAHQQLLRATMSARPKSPAQIAAAGEAWFSIGWMLRGQETLAQQPDLAIMAASAYEHALALNCRKAECCDNLGNLYHRHLREPQRAEECYRRAMELRPQSSCPHIGLADLYQGPLDQPERAEPHYLRAIELDATYWYPHRQLGYLYQRQLHRYAAAEKHYRRVLELSPSNAQSHVGLGQVYHYHLQQPTLAEGCYLAAITLQPHDACALRMLGLLCKDYLQQPLRAEECYRKAIAADPANPRPHTALGYLRESQGRWAEAAAAYQQSLACDDAYAPALRGLAWVALLSRGAVEETRRLYDRAHAAEPKAGTLNVFVYLAAEVWAANWPVAQYLWNEWVKGLQAHEDWMLWQNRERVCALLRQAHAAGLLPAFAAVLPSDRPCWRPFVQAVDAFTTHRAEGALPSEPQAGAIFDLLHKH
ncbi:tetratricopeptide repeat protein [Prosthecobacter sp.]|uniref:tetratricopeptide repeat protein n=1 Tax=Prosthecobacter sp. TaxID=1965333 RepID=UPI0037848409